jgi:hypothetical protein
MASKWGQSGCCSSRKSRKSRKTAKKSRKSVKKSRNIAILPRKLRRIHPKSSVKPSQKVELIRSTRKRTSKRRVASHRDRYKRWNAYPWSLAMKAAARACRKGDVAPGALTALAALKVKYKCVMKCLPSSRLTKAMNEQRFSNVPCVFLPHGDQPRKKVGRGEIKLFKSRRGMPNNVWAMIIDSAGDCQAIDARNVYIAPSHLNDAGITSERTRRNAAAVTNTKLYKPVWTRK